MAVDQRLLLSDGSNTYAFDLGGVVSPEVRPTWKNVAGVRQLEALEERWPVRGAAILGSSLADAATKLDTFLGHLLDRTGNPLTFASLQRSDGGGGWVTVRTIGAGGGGYQQEFGWDEVGWDDPDPRFGGAVARQVRPIRLVLSARRVFEDANGIVSWDQRVSVTAGRDGLKVIEWQTELEVRQGASTSALETARTHAVIPKSDYGGTYVWDTNSDDGFDYEFPETDEAASPAVTPTRIRCTSRIRQKGISLGTDAAGSGVGDLIRSVETIREGLRTTTITRAEAIGPGAETALQSQRPSDPLALERLSVSTSERTAAGEWHQITQDVIRWRIEAVVTGGGQDKIHDETAGNRPPELVLGAWRAVRLEVRVVVSALGREPALSEMPFPKRLGAPWEYFQNESNEHPFPELAEIGTEREYDVYERVATLVYEAAAADDAARTELLKLYGADGAGVETHLFSGPEGGGA